MYDEFLKYLLDESQIAVCIQQIKIEAKIILREEHILFHPMPL
jgi:hypothetical protein